jgi:hypothetical protein
MKAMWVVVQQAGQQLNTAVTTRFHGVMAQKVPLLLDTMAALALLRVVDEENVYTVY